MRAAPDDVGFQPVDEGDLGFREVESDGRGPVRTRVLSSLEASLVVAYKEILVNLRTKRFYFIGGVFLVVFLGLSLLLSFLYDGMIAQLFRVAQEGAQAPSAANIIFGIYLLVPLVGGVTILKLLAISFSFDGIVREHEDKSLFLLLSKPISRASVVYGKFFGAFGGTAGLFVVVALLGHAVMQLITRDLVSLREFVGFLGAIGVLVLGMSTFASLSLLSSALWRSTTVSILFTLGVLLFLLPMVSGLFRLALVFSGVAFGDEWWLVFLTHLDPGFSMGAALAPLVWSLQLGATGEFILMGVGGGMNARHVTWLALAVLAGETLLFLGLTQWVVARRNFE